MRRFPNGDSILIALGAMLLVACAAQPTAPADAGAGDGLEQKGSVLALSVHPTRAVIQPHDTIAFDAEIVVSEDVEEMPALEWRATGGTITSNGVLIAGTATGTIDVTVEVRGRERQAHAEVLVVEEPQPASVRIVPGRAAVHPGDTTRFEAVVHDDQGFRMNESVTWTAAGGSIDSSGLFTARTVTGTFSVGAAGPAGLADTAVVEITEAPPVPMEITISPTWAEFSPGSTLQFEAVVRDQYGDPFPWAVQWSATGGEIGPDGHYTAGTASGEYEVMAAGPDGLSATTPIQIEEEEPVASSVEVSPAAVQLTSGQAQQFSATVVDQHGEPMLLTPSWTAIGGAVTSGGVYTAGGEEGSYPVVATISANVTDTAWVTITETPSDPLDPQPNGPAGDYALILEDQFETLDLDTWSYNYPWSPVIINNEKQLYVASQVVADGTLKITAIREHAVDENGYEYDYQSGAITSYQKFEFLYGVIEFRAKVPEGRGLWPALWVNPPPGSWPPEIDVMENLGQDPFTMYHNVHWKDAQGNHQAEGATVTGGPDYSQAFHTYTAEWTPDTVTFWIDGVQTGQVAGHSPSIPLYPIINMAVGGNWPGDPDGSTPFPAVFEVDYVRVWQE